MSGSLNLLSNLHSLECNHHHIIGKSNRVIKLISDAERQDMGSTMIKELNLSGARIYYKQMSEMLIPTSLWESTRHLENQIFDAMPVESLTDLMKE